MQKKSNTNNNSNKIYSNKIYLINGPNLNLLGQREKNIYGSKTLAEIENSLLEEAKKKAVELKIFQNNEEGKIVNFIHSMEEGEKLIINAAAYTHTSIAIRDAILAKKICTIEVHLSNIFQREGFRHHSFLSDISIAVISGLGDKGYFYALDYFLTK